MSMRISEDIAKTLVRGFMLGKGKIGNRTIPDLQNDLFGPYVVNKLKSNVLRQAIEFPTGHTARDAMADVLLWT